MPSRALAIASRADEPRAVRRVEAEHDEADGRRRAACSVASTRRRAVAGEDVGFAERQRHQALERAGRALAQHRDRRDQEHDDEREESAQRRADALEDVRPTVEAVKQQQERRRNEQQQRDASAGRAGSAAARAARSPTSPARSCRVARSITARKALPRSLLAGLARATGRGRLSEERAVAHQQELVALCRLVHDVAGDQQRGARRPRARGRSARARRAGRGRDRRWARRGPAVRARRGGRKRATRASAPRRRASRPSGRRRHPARPSSISRRPAPAGAGDRGEVAKVLLDAEVAIHRGRLGHVADAASQVVRARGAHPAP